MLLDLAHIRALVIKLHKIEVSKQVSKGLIYIAHTQKKISNALSTFCRQYLVKSMSSQLTFESVETVLGREVCHAANSKSTGPQQQNADDRNRSVGSVVRSTCAEWQSADVDDQ